MTRAVRAPATTALAVAVIGAGMVLRMIGLHRGLWLDEYTTLLQLDPHDALQTLSRVRFDTHHPLYFALLALWSKVSMSLPWLRLLSALIDLATMVALWLWLRNISARGALLTLMYVATAPLFVRFGLELRPYGLLTCTTALSMWATHAVTTRPSGARWALWSAALTALVATHPVGALFVPPLALWLLCQRAPEANAQPARRVSSLGFWEITEPSLALATGPTARFIRRFIVLTAALVAPVTAFALLHWVYQVLPTLNAIAWMPHLSGSLIAKTLEYLAGTPEANLPRLAQAGSAAVLAAWCILLLTQRRSHAWPMALWGLGFFALVAAYSIVGTPIFWYRSLMPACLCVVVFLAMHTAALPEGWRRNVGVLAMATLCGLQLWQTTRTLEMPVEPSPEVGTVLRREWAPHSMALYYPDYLGASVRAEADGIPAANIDSLEDMHEPRRGAFTSNVFVAARVDLDLAQTPDRLAQQLQRRLHQFPGAHDVEVMLVPGHDLNVVDETYAVNDVVQALTKRFGQPTELPQVGALARWEFKVRAAY